MGTGRHSWAVDVRGGQRARHTAFYITRVGRSKNWLCRGQSRLLHPQGVPHLCCSQGRRWGALGTVGKRYGLGRPPQHIFHTHTAWLQLHDCQEDQQHMGGRWNRKEMRTTEPRRPTANPAQPRAAVVVFSAMLAAAGLQRNQQHCSIDRLTLPAQQCTRDQQHRAGIQNTAACGGSSGGGRRSPVGVGSGGSGGAATLGAQQPACINASSKTVQRRSRAARKV